MIGNEQTVSVTEQMGGAVTGQYTITKRNPPFSSGVPPYLLGSLSLMPEERRLSMPEIGEKERDYLF